ncbi:MAG: Histidine kinase [Acidobacteriaceae bacterium]|jgi:two-component system sensor histidine kinase CpxA|nr:Histidine kinase [Acidobacteriaceae bacterium]
MKSLFFKIFISFWLVVALFVVVAILVTVAMRPTRQVSAIEAQQSKILSEAVSIYEAGGPDRLRDYLRNIRDKQHLRAALFRDGEGVAGHPLPPWFVEVAKGQRHTMDTILGRLNPHFQMLRVSMTGSDGHNYMLVTELPPGQGALFGPNGVPGLGILIAVLTSGLVCYLLAKFLTSPVLRLRKAAQKLASGDLSTRVGAPSSPGGDEVSQLLRDFDLMAEQIEKLVNAQSRLLKDISHELRSPLARLSVALELARQRTGPEGQSILDRISLESNRMNELIGSLTTIARLESGAGSIRKQPVHLEDLVQEVARDAAFEAQTRNTQVECEILDELPVSGDPALLRSAIENVVRNATRYTREGTAVVIRAEKKKSGNIEEAYIQVSDSGPGVSEGELDKIFKPFYRIDDARERSTGGVGLGLAITDQAIRLHGGSVRASNSPEGGLLVEMRIPLQFVPGLRDQRTPVAASGTS